MIMSYAIMDIRVMLFNSDSFRSTCFDFESSPFFSCNKSTFQSNQPVTKLAYSTKPTQSTPSTNQPPQRNQPITNPRKYNPLF